MTIPYTLIVVVGKYNKLLEGPNLQRGAKLVSKYLQATSPHPITLVTDVPGASVGPKRTVHVKDDPKDVVRTFEGGLEEAQKVGAKTNYVIYSPTWSNAQGRADMTTLVLARFQVKGTGRAFQVPKHLQKQREDSGHCGSKRVAVKLTTYSNPVTRHVDTRTVFCEQTVPREAIAGEVRFPNGRPPVASITLVRALGDNKALAAVQRMDIMTIEQAKVLYRHMGQLLKQYIRLMDQQDD